MLPLLKEAVNRRGGAKTLRLLVGWTYIEWRRASALIQIRTTIISHRSNLNAKLGISWHLNPKETVKTKEAKIHSSIMD